MRERERGGGEGERRGRENSTLCTAQRQIDAFLHRPELGDTSQNPKCNSHCGPEQPAGVVRETCAIPFYLRPGSAWNILKNFASQVATSTRVPNRRRASRNISFGFERVRKNFSIACLGHDFDRREEKEFIVLRSRDEANGRRSRYTRILSRSSSSVLSDSHVTRLKIHLMQDVVREISCSFTRRMYRYGRAII